MGNFETEIEAAKCVNFARKKHNMKLKNPELADEAEVKFSSPKIFIKPSENITWENHHYWPIAVMPEDSDTSRTDSL